ncbi:unnamed protein product [Polarella glacialis]|uniref:Uncharacterized protein n=1 Tax=Polarella glacialis TaxID=89957 RepID=A0A813LN10_POLGL|nr:unnamed protein product [Polarella glacialis]
MAFALVAFYFLPVAALPLAAGQLAQSELTFASALSADDVCLGKEGHACSLELLQLRGLGQDHETQEWIGGAHSEAGEMKDNAVMNKAKEDINEAIRLSGMKDEMGARASVMRALEELQRAPDCSVKNDRAKKHLHDALDVIGRHDFAASTSYLNKARKNLNHCEEFGLLETDRETEQWIGGAHSVAGAVVGDAEMNDAKSGINEAIRLTAVRDLIGAKVSVMKALGTLDKVPECEIKVYRAKKELKDSLGMIGRTDFARVAEYLQGAKKELSLCEAYGLLETDRETQQWIGGAHSEAGEMKDNAVMNKAKEDINEAIRLSGMKDEMGARASVMRALENLQRAPDCSVKNDRAKKHLHDALDVIGRHDFAASTSYLDKARKNLNHCEEFGLLETDRETEQWIGGAHSVAGAVVGRAEMNDAKSDINEAIRLTAVKDLIGAKVSVMKALGTLDKVPECEIKVYRAKKELKDSLGMIGRTDFTRVAEYLQGAKKELSLCEAYGLLETEQSTEK